MDEQTLAKMEELVDQELSKYIRPPDNNNVKIKSSISYIEAEKIFDAKPPEDWMKPFPTQTNK